MTVDRVRRLSPVIVLATLLSCASDRLTLLEAPPEDLAAEADRLRSMQMVRVIDPYGAVAEYEAKEFAGFVLVACTWQDVDFYATNLCIEGRFAHFSLCTANTLLDIASIRAEPRTLDMDGDPKTPDFSVPAQSEATNAALARQAMSYGMAAAAYATNSLRASVGLGSYQQYDPLYQDPMPPPQCSLTTTLNNGDSQASFLSTTLVEAFHLHRQAAERAVKATLAVAEAQRSTTSSPVEKAAREVAGAQLSRADAAHLLIGGTPGLNGTTTSGFCSSPELSQQAQVAVSLFREAAPDPQKILDEPAEGSGGVSIERLLDGDLATVPDGSVRMRLAELWNYQDLATPGNSVTTFFQLKTSDFVDARHYLAEEIRAFSRSRTAVLEAKTLVGGQESTYPRYAGAAAPPGPHDDAYYVATATYGRNNYQVIGSTLASFTAEYDNLRNADPQKINVSSYVDRSLADASLILAMRANIDPQIVDDVIAPLGMLAGQAKAERPARVETYCVTSGCAAVVYNHTAADALLLVVGEDGLRCATRGSIEGAPCNVDNHTLPVIYAEDDWNPGYDSSFVFVTAGEGTGGEAPPFGRYYLVKPRGPTTEPGTYDVVAGWSMRDYAETYDVPVVPYADRWAAEILAPSREWCSRSQLTCAGQTFDARLPLEDELSSDGDDVESSWKHHLALARQAADKADALGEEYIEKSLQSDQWDNQTSLQALDKRLRVEAELERIQAICGTAVETGTLMEALGIDLSGTVTTESCNADSDCSDYASGRICVVGACIMDPAKFAKTHPEDGDLTRLAECLGSDTVDSYASMGNVALCLWHREGNPNYICEKASDKNPCPYLPENAPDYQKDPPPETPTCGGNVPGGQDEAFTVPLGFFDIFAHPPASPTNSVVPLVDDQGQPVDPSDAQTQPLDVCRQLREARKTKNETKLNQIAASNFFNPDNLAEFAELIGWEARPGSFSAITLDKVVLWDTGSLEKEAAGTLDDESAGWPCYGGTYPPECGTTQAGLFCDVHVGQCTSLSQRMALNYRMLHAVEAARFLGVRKGDPIFRGIRYPVYLPAYSLSGWSKNTAPYPGQSPEVLTTYSHQTWKAYDADVGLAWDGEPYQAADGRFFSIGEVRTDAEPFIGQSLGSDGWWHGLSLKVGVPATLTQFCPPVCSGGSSCCVKTEYLVPGNEGSWLRNALLGTVITTPWPYAEDLPEWKTLTDPPLDKGSGDAMKIVLGSLAHYGFKWRGWQSRGDGAVLQSPPDGDPQYGNDSFWYYYAPGLPDGSKFGKHHTEALYDRTVLVPPMDEPTVRRALLDGMELLCAVGLKKSIPCDQRDPPAINTVHDLAKARDFLSCSGAAMQSRAGMTVFANMPKQATDLMRKSSVSGSYPAVGGELGAAISELRGALIQASESSYAIGSEVRQFGIDLDSVRIALVNADLTGQMASVQFIATVGNQLTACAVGGSQAAGAFNVTDFGAGMAGAGLAAAATCANSIAQIEFAGQLNSLQQAQADLAKDEAFLALKQSFETRAGTLHNLGTELRAATERIDAQLALIENMHNEAKRALSRALYMASFQAEKQLEINTAMRARVNTTRIRYEQAHKNAIFHSFVAKRAIEQRIGLRLSEMVEELPLVEAPARWEANLCSTVGVDYSDVSAPEAAENVNFADSYIGDYVTKLENVVESYRLAYNFHEGADTAVISLRDDVVKARRDCEAPVGNLLYQAGQPDHLTVNPALDPGWQLRDCATTVGENGSELLPNCIAITPLGASPFPAVLPHPDMGNASGYAVRFGTGTGVCAPTDMACGFRASSALVQSVTLHPGRYRVSWYGNPSGVSESATYDDDAVTVMIGGAEVPRVALPGPGAPTLGKVQHPGFWRRYYFLFDVALTQEGEVVIRMPQGMQAPTQVQLAALMMEDVSTSAVGDAAVYEPRVFANTADTLTRVRPVCEDTHGDVFRRKHWDRQCVLLCPDGFDGSCGASDAQTHCYREITFSINQRAIESGDILKASGFAKGNFNYRLQRIGVNFVGTGVRDCTSSTLPSSCYGAGHAMYSLVHGGPYFVRNALGNDYTAHLFTGRIEQARGLAAERYLTNPISTTDRELIEQYLRLEFNGRPLDGQFVLRVWEDPTVNFEAVEDVQVVLDYRYWTRFD
jgi:hypothetical protein